MSDISEDELLDRRKPGFKRRLLLSIALRHPPSARWPQLNVRGKKRLAIPPGGLREGK